MEMETKSESQGSTYCSELELSQQRRSQRLREKTSQKVKRKASAPSTLPSPDRKIAKLKAGSPQLFVETDEECSQPWEHWSRDELLPLAQRRQQNDAVAKKRSVCSETPEVDAMKPTVAKRSRKSSSKSKPAVTVRSQSRIRKTSVAAAKRSHQQPYMAPPMSLPTKLYGRPKVAPPFLATQSVLPAQYPAHFVHQLPPPPPVPPNFIANAVLAELQRAALQRAQSSAGPPIATPIAPISNRQLCPTPDATPIIDGAFAPYSQSPNSQSLISTSPSLSESLGKEFGTTNICKILNIAETRKYLLLDIHLPAMAIMLNVDLGRLRTVINLTQRLTLEQLQQMAQDLGEPSQELPQQSKPIDKEAQ